MITNLSHISVQQLKRAIVLREQIEALEHELTGILGQSGSATPSVKVDGRRRKMSAASRAKIAAGQRARWARQKKGRTSQTTVVKRKMTPAWRAKIAAAARARWAKARAANRTSLANP